MWGACLIGWKNFKRGFFYENQSKDRKTRFKKKAGHSEEGNKHPENVVSKEVVVLSKPFISFGTSPLVPFKTNLGALTSISPPRHKDTKNGGNSMVLKQNPFWVTWCLGGEKGFC
jgi:hypothetical protein